VSVVDQELKPSGERDERSLIEAWRLERLLDLGISLDIASRIAAGTLDLHELERLIKRGCNPHTAISILA
jgi:hypothetical protein